MLSRVFVPCSRHLVSLKAQSELWKRSFVTTSVFNYYKTVKDIYKQIDYTAPFSDQESKAILHKVNECTQSELRFFTNQRCADHIVQHRLDHGQFELVEQLLDVPSFDPRKIERLGKNVIKQLNNDTQKIVDKIADLGKIHKKLVRQVKPKIEPMHYLSEEIKTICGIKFTLTSLSFAHMTKTPRNLLNWSNIVAFEDVSSKAAFDHHKIDLVARNLVEQIPVADLYIFEEQMPIMMNNKDPFLLGKLRLLETQASLVSLLNSRKPSGQNKVHLMKINVLDQLFDLKIGTERVSLQRKFKELVLDRHDFKVNFSPELWQTYNDVDVKSDREQLASTCLLAIAFDHLFSKM